MKFRNFLASVMVGCARGHAGWSLIPSPRLGVPMEIGSKLISGLKCCYVCMLFVFFVLHVSSRLGEPCIGRLVGRRRPHLVERMGRCRCLQK